MLEVIDFRLPTCAEAGLILWLGQDFQTKCLTQDPLTVVSNVQQNVTMRFYTLAHAKHGGFLIKYSVLPVSNNATVRLQCYTAPAVSRSPESANLPPPNPAQQAPPHIPIADNPMNIAIEQGGGGGGDEGKGDHGRHGEGAEMPISPFFATHENDLTKRFPSGHDGASHIVGTLDGPKVCERESVFKHEVDISVCSRTPSHWLASANNNRTSLNSKASIKQCTSDVRANPSLAD